MSDSADLNDDFRDMLQALAACGVEFVVVGAHALAAHGLPRATGDIDILVRPTNENAKRVMDALERFGAPVAAHGVTHRDFATPGRVYQLGLPPRRIDLLTEITGVTFEEAWSTRVNTNLGGVPAPVLGLTSLVKNKRATGRDKDLLDVRTLTSSAQRDRGPSR